MVDYELTLPNDFDDYAWEVESKGWFSAAIVRFEGKQYRLNFYDPERLAQEIEDTLSNNNFFIDDNVIVVKSVDRMQMQDAAEYLVKSGRINFFRPETEDGSDLAS